MLAAMFSNDYWTFWDVFFVIWIVVPLLMVWGFTMFDIFTRRTLSGWAKALWLVVIVVLPFIGTLAYLIFRPWGEALPLETV